MIPWIMGQVMDFLVEDKATHSGSYQIMADGIASTQQAHSDVIAAKYARIKKGEEDKI